MAIIGLTTVICTVLYTFSTVEQSIEPPAKVFILESYEELPKAFFYNACKSFIIRSKVCAEGLSFYINEATCEVRKSHPYFDLDTGISYYISTTTPKALALKAELEKDIPLCLQYNKERKAEQKKALCSQPVDDLWFEEYKLCNQ